MLPPNSVWEAKAATRLAWVWVEPRRRRLYGKSSQTTSQMSPMEPVVRKAACHPHLLVTKATRTGATKKLTFDPELKRPVAKARSSDGNHSVVAFMAAGKLPDSPRPRMIRAMQKPMTEKTSAWLSEASAQTAIARA